MNPMLAQFFDERQLKEIEFNRLYAREFHHGTPDHNLRMLVAKLAELLEIVASEIDDDIET